MPLPLPARLFLFILPLGLDTFALSLALGVQPLPLARRVRLALWFACFEAVMPAVGLLLGLPLGTTLGAWGAYLAGALLVLVGLWMVREAMDDDDDEAEKLGTLGQGLRWGLVGLGFSVSLDELAVGFSFGVLGLPLGLGLALIGGQALCVSLLGQALGSRFGAELGERAELVAGVLLVVLGLALIVTRAVGLDL